MHFQLVISCQADNYNKKTHSQWGFFLHFFNKWVSCEAQAELIACSLCAATAEWPQKKWLSEMQILPLPNAFVFGELSEQKEQVASSQY